jgi:hypothetical protein
MQIAKLKARALTRRSKSLQDVSTRESSLPHCKTLTLRFKGDPKWATGRVANSVIEERKSQGARLFDWVEKSAIIGSGTGYTSDVERAWLTKNKRTPRKNQQG